MMIRSIVTDIEGTTSSLSFVKEVLFPYAASHLQDYLLEHHRQPAVRAQLEVAAEIAGLPPGDTQALADQLRQWIGEDKKVTPLKELQGMIWEAGYASGDYQAHLYPDAVQNLRLWFDQGLDLYVYSSGSIHAQKLFFQYSDVGDLRPLFRGFFDTTTGPKSEPESYQKIAQAIAIPSAEILFLSDVEAELDGAREAGFNTVRLVRMHDYAMSPAQAGSSHPAVAGFDEIQLDLLG